MKLAYAIENIRRIKNFPEIELRPLTVLVGRNSAGKSTFLRSLPLIRQSLETRSSAPILWYGELVDFGDSDVAIGRDQENKQAAFRFTLRNVRGRRSPYYYPYEYYSRSRIVHVDCVAIRYVIGVRDDNTILQAIEIKIPDESIDISINFESRSESRGEITINGQRADFIPKDYHVWSINRDLFSSPRFISRSTGKEAGVNRLTRPQTVLMNVLTSTLRNHTSRKLGDETIRKEVRRLLLVNKFNSAAIVKLRNRASTVTFKKIYQHLLSDDTSHFKHQIFAIKRLARAFDVLETVDQELTDYFLNVGYLQPVRAASERFYRKQELEVSGIAPNGSNFPMFLASLAPRELHRFSEWVRSIFGYGVSVHRTSGHISVHVQSGEKSINVTDTGYGISQILPVLGIIWWAQSPRLRRSAPRRRSNFQTLAIEQPELHLHPAHQAKLADVFVAAIGHRKSEKDKSGLGLVVETHSEAMIQRLGELVEGRKVSADDIQIVIFSAPDDLDSPTEISISRFNDAGVLINWPFGFFNYSDE